MAEKKEKKVFGFFNCDADKNYQSMNVYYNSLMFADTKAARKKLFAKVEEELAAGKVQIDEGAVDSVKQAILEGDPTAANDSLRFGAIVAFSIV